MSSGPSRNRGDRGGGRRGRGDSPGGPHRGRGDGGGRGGGGSRSGGGDRGRGGGYRGDRGGGGGDRGGRGDGGGRGRGGDGGGPPAQGQQMHMASHPSQAGRPIYLDGWPVPDPEGDVRLREDALVGETKGKMIDGFPARPGYGTQGMPIILRTNYFKITTAGNDTLHRYDIAFSAELTRNKRADLVKQLVQQPMFNNIHWATDYGKFLVTTAQLNFGGLKEWKTKLTVTPPPGNSQTTQGPAPGFVQQAQQRNTAEVRLTFNRTYSLSEMIQYLRSVSPGASYLGNEDLIQMLNIIICKPPRASSTITSVGGNKFYPFHGDALSEIFNLKDGLQALRGYFSSVRPAVGRLLLNINVTSGAFYEPIPMTTAMAKLKGKRNELMAFAKGLKVEAKYVRNNERAPYMTKVKTIFGFWKQTNPSNPRDTRLANANQAEFQYTDASGTVTRSTVSEYFENIRGITLQLKEHPVLNVGTARDPQFLPPELCTILPGQPYRALLQPDQTSEMIKFAARYPHQNAMSIAGTVDAPGNGLVLFGLAGGNNVQQNTVMPFGLNIDTNMLTVPGRILLPPKIAYGGSKNAEKDVRSGSWNLANTKFRRGGRFDSWQVMVINTKRQDETELPPQQLFQTFEKAITGYGIQLGTRGPMKQVVLRERTHDNRGANNRTLEEAFEQAKGNSKSKVILFILPDKDRWLYSRIKFYGDVKFGIHTVNAVRKNIEKVQGQEMFFGNLALKINVKGGGVAHEVPNTLVGPVGNNTIIFGIDVTHPSTNSAKGAPSIACVVANTDATLFHWPGSIRSQAARQEMVGSAKTKTGSQEARTMRRETVDELKDMVVERMKLWQKKNQTRLPDRVVIYRDGVSEGQFKLVLEQELPSFQAAYKQLYGAEPKWPKTAIIIVGKRHHTRFYPTKPEDADQYTDKRTNQVKGSWNTKPGTVVDRGIVGRIIREFYLQAHQGLQGTVKPAHYSVIKDDIGFNADQLERFTLNLCYYFARCTKAVSICPPAYYADLLAERGRAYLYTTLQESHADDASSISSSSQAEWQGGVHRDIAESTWYI